MSVVRFSHSIWMGNERTAPLVAVELLITLLCTCYYTVLLLKNKYDDDISPSYYHQMKT